MTLVKYVFDQKTWSIAFCLFYQSQKWVTGIYLCQASPKKQKIVKRHKSRFLVKFLQKNNVKEQGQQGRWSSSAIKRGRNPHHALSLKCFENTLKTSAHPAYEVLQTSMLNMINLYLHAFSRWPYWWISLDLPFLVLAFHPLIISCTYRKKVQGWFYRSIDFFTHLADQKPTTS